jgi:hypothetical protein
VVKTGAFNRSATLPYSEPVLTPATRFASLTLLAQS